MRKLCRAGMPPSSGVQCIDLRGVSEVAPARDCSIAQREAPNAAPGVLTDYGVEFVRDVRRAKATGAADVGRSNTKGVSEGASARDCGMVTNAEISKGVSDGAKRETVQTSKDAEIGKGVSNLRSVKCSMANDGRIGRGVSNGRQPVMLESEMKELAAPWMGAVPTPPIGNKSQA